MRILIIAGTRPEIIKCAPIYLLGKQEPDLTISFCNTGQHEEMAKQALDIFKIKPEYDLRIMRNNQNINQIISRIAERLPAVFEDFMPDVVVVQGDTTTAMVAALLAFNARIKVAHLEAGLRTGNIREPFPEEANRKIIGAIADVHFCPTATNIEALRAENIHNNIFQVGNSVVDAISIMQQSHPLSIPKHLRSKIGIANYILVTTHRRENFGQGILNICESIVELSMAHPDIKFVFPVHHNPNIRDVVLQKLDSISSVHLIKPVNYIEMLSLIKNSLFCITDSGGIQEEAPSFGKYCLVLRNFTERNETIDTGFSELVGTDKQRIISRAQEIIATSSFKMDNKFNPYGDGHTTDKVLQILREITCR